VWALVALRRVSLSDDKWVRLLFHDADPEVRFECLRWIADAVLVKFSADVEQMLTQADLDYRLFEAVLAASNTLRGKPEAGITDVEVLVERVTNAATPARLKGYALRLVPATHPKINVAMLRELFAEHYPVLSLEVVRTLAARNADDGRVTLAEIANDEAQTPELRAEAIVGLASSAKPEHRRLLLALAAHDNAIIRDEALRGLRLSSLDAAEQKSLDDLARRRPETAELVKVLLDPASINAGRPGPDDTAAWLKRLAALPGKANAETGRRIFFHPRIALCATCHRHSGRGNVVGPDLSLVAQQGGPTATLRSILEPSREIAPQYYHTVLQLKDGTVFSGILLRSSHADVFRDVSGKERTFHKEDIEERMESKTSLMPAGVVSSLTDNELRDLLAFLAEGADFQESIKP
jgi:putative heme-binding domain-containing protein